ncbi:PREDICTED: uncharacterized protein LOC100636531 [Amphimedon queenslandica]|uniref:Uncharacterized protein n=1 Tax=Amphimedon queenslandica TaxID=400682 RepID=A0A1X7V4N6_AMPQE|nr:PREDICTED: uncharacterized protein LOC100636531 [Amphimedon queenslandica]|eukprot:XP_003385707.1 PREDICTED: uncharacterized protein LOC100636531 [Amphimedon queenslandica]
MSDDAPFLHPKDESGDKPPPVYYDRSSTPAMRYIVIATLVSVVISLLVAVIVVVVKTATANTLFSLLLVSLLAFSQVEFFLVYFVYKEKMPRAYVWTIFVVATFIFVESICTIIVVTTT